MYAESVWYAGRQHNYVQLYHHCMEGVPRGDAPRGERDDAVNQNPSDIFESPKYITGMLRKELFSSSVCCSCCYFDAHGCVVEDHIKATLDKLGYDSAAGAKVFNVLCETLYTRGLMRGGSKLVSEAPLQSALMNAFTVPVMDEELGWDSAHSEYNNSMADLRTPYSSQDPIKYRMDVEDFVRWEV